MNANRNFKIRHGEVLGQTQMIKISPYGNVPVKSKLQP